MAHYTYAYVEYETKEALDAAIVLMKESLETKPTLWCEVKELSGDAESGWVVPDTFVSDADILNASDEKFYSIYSGYSGETLLGLTGTNLLQKVYDYRLLFARYHKVNSVFVDTAPDNEDMSVYI